MGHATWLCAGAGILVVATTIGLLGTCDSCFENRLDAPQEFPSLERAARARTRVVEELVTGRCTLFEAVARFRELSAESPVDLMPYLRIFHPDRTDDELHYLHVLMHVQSNCRRRDNDESIVDTLRQEFESRRVSGTLTIDVSDTASSNR